MPEEKNHEYRIYRRLIPLLTSGITRVSPFAKVSNEVREFMVDAITKVGGHFGAGLGVVELTVALHIFNTPGINCP